jgi:hypothetical protein
MLLREVIAFDSENHTKSINKLYGQDVKLLNVKAGVIYSYHCALMG